MRPCRSNLFVVAAALLLAGCAFDDGKPWGRAEFDVSVAFDPPASRLDDGRLKTSKNYLVSIDELTATFDAIELEIRSGGESAGFDPANPPEGYSLCHNGHCHSDSGGLVPYDEIELQEAAGDLVVTQGVVDGGVRLDTSPRTLELGACSEDCELQRGAPALVRLSIPALHVSGSASRVADDSEPLEFDFTWEIDAAPATVVSTTPIGPGEPGGAVVSASFDLPASFLDPVDFVRLLDEPGDPDQLADDVRAVIEESAALSVTINRYAL